MYKLRNLHKYLYLYIISYSFIENDYYFSFFHVQNVCITDIFLEKFQLNCSSVIRIGNFPTFFILHMKYLMKLSVLVNKQMLYKVLNFLQNSNLQAENFVLDRNRMLPS